MATEGKRAGSRRGPKKARSLQPSLLGLAVGVTLAVVAWGYLVYAAIDFGATARDGDSQAWWFLAIASLGAVACLFIGLMLIARLLRRLGITGEATARPPASPASPASPAPLAPEPSTSPARVTPVPPISPVPHKHSGGHRAR